MESEMQLGRDGRFDEREKERENCVVGGVMMSKWWQMRLLVEIGRAHV